jgi:hypothetical protein
MADLLFVSATTDLKIVLSLFNFVSDISNSLLANFFCGVGVLKVAYS